ncbi:sec-independent protein translocase protein TatB [Microbacterium foliorum]|uniref:Sec-independent protein translocase protein TatB n=1 Tax=Microbacterium foliorum TaxID=104336 RepID=A0ABU1HV95_9MICO|nr:twin-arginine translocase TatA/TatE family subunit [Microbacterium foliorum]MDR6143991.1 sec-independent protein translocase protein TatB [Microbacterium foliorum]
MTMFGLTIEKLFLVALIAAVIIGPRRLPEYARRLGALVRRVTLLAGDAARRAEQETGVASIRQDWTALDPRQYDPRRIIRDAWAAGESAEPREQVPIVTENALTEDSASADAADDARPEPEGAWITAGSSGHPRRVWVPAES